MATWSKNHRACTTTWSTLLALTQLNETFKDAGELPMTGLTFWTGSADARRTRAEGLATQIDNIFRIIRRARFEEGVTETDAASGLVSALLNAEGSVADLAEVADQKYHFWREDEVA